MSHKPLQEIKDACEIPTGFSPVAIAAHRCYTNGKPKEGIAWFSGGNQLEVPSLEGQADRVGMAVSCSLHIVIARVTAPQPPCRRVTWCRACYNSDPLTMDIQAAVLWGSIEGADVDLCQQLVKHLEAHPVTFR